MSIIFLMKIRIKLKHWHKLAQNTIVGIWKQKQKASNVNKQDQFKVAYDKVN